jgi:chemotaxis protein methyltransferase CheR
VHTYYNEDLQREITQRLFDALQPGGLMVLGSHETLTDDVPGFVPLSYNRGIYKKGLPELIHPGVNQTR